MHLIKIEMSGNIHIYSVENQRHKQNKKKVSIIRENSAQPEQQCAFHSAN